MEGKNYIKALVYVFVALGLFIVAIASAYFGSVGLFFGQAVVEGDVFTGAYKYECNNVNETASQCTSISNTTKTQPFIDYEAFRTAVNATTLLYVAATAILFALLGLVFLFLALRESGLLTKMKSSKKDEDY